MRDWLTKADKFYQDSKRAIYPPFTKASAGYLLHLSIELYLKAYLIDRNEITTDTALRRAGHDLERLFKRCMKLEPLFEYVYQGDHKDQLDWIEYLNGFGYPDGGVRYGFTASTDLPEDVHTYFENLVVLVEQAINKTRVITELIYSD